MKRLHLAVLFSILPVLASAQTNPAANAARQWRQPYDTLAGRPNLEAAYVIHDKFGYPVFYVIRNHGFALAPK